MCGLSLAWVTCENSTMLLKSDILRLFFTGPYLVSSPLCSGVWYWHCPCPWIHANFCCSPLSSPAATPLPGPSPPTSALLPPTASLGLQPPTVSLGLLPPTALCSPGSRRQLSFASPYHFRVRRDFMSKNPLSGFAPKQTIESSALAAYPHSATDGSSCQILLGGKSDKFFLSLLSLQVRRILSILLILPVNSDLAGSQKNPFYPAYPSC